jgi:hypothetical protein
MARGLLFYGTLKRVKVYIKVATNDSLFRFILVPLRTLVLILVYGIGRGKRS